MKNLSRRRTERTRRQLRFNFEINENENENYYRLVCWIFLCCVVSVRHILPMSWSGLIPAIADYAFRVYYADGFQLDANDACVVFADGLAVYWMMMPLMLLVTMLIMIMLNIIRMENILFIKDEGITLNLHNIKFGIKMNFSLSLWYAN